MTSLVQEASMEDKVVLICATGRSGSTTLQRILNTLPNSNICGENKGAINSLLEFYRRIKVTTMDYTPGSLQPTSYEDLIAENTKPSWYNSYDYQQIVQHVRTMIINMFKNRDTTNIWGFKEIRYDSGSIDYINDFKELFPQTKVIIQIRENVQAQCQSGWFESDDTAPGFLTKTSSELVAFGELNKEWCYITSFEKMFQLDDLRTMFKFIGCEDNFHATKISEILKNNLKD